MKKLLVRLPQLQDPVGFLSELHVLGIELYLHQQGLDTTTPAGKAMFQMLGVFAEFERSIVRTRVVAGMARAKAKARPRAPGAASRSVGEVCASISWVTGRFRRPSVPCKVCVRPFRGSPGARFCSGQEDQTGQGRRKKEGS